ncbi:hypothetical protein B0H65DRAFT_459452 [Neurospora tetraspora]|uniref:Uncharacterized protein n=1 Tax=Neurospora tetraspora TaxID=94610 RepID=A0AAE0MVL5_9PEZI|nr:hypothetical protein B0H65DRAFT_459452 [Neurospora tetraspora]
MLFFSVLRRRVQSAVSAVFVAPSLPYCIWMECDRHRETQTIPSQAAMAYELSMFGRRNQLENSEGGFHIKTNATLAT